MTPDQYVELVLRKYEVPRGANSPAEKFGAAVEGPLAEWAGTQLSGLQYSGSYAKETGVRGTSDVDVFISLKSDTEGTLSAIYESLAALAQSNGWQPRRQTVSVGVVVGGTRGDLVPGRIQPGYRNYHSLYNTKRKSRKQTNVAKHLDVVGSSGRTKEIRAIKIWRMLHGLDFPSLYLELFAIDALSGRSRSALAENTLHVLREIGSSLITRRIVDPANTNNILSEDLTTAEKQLVATQATRSAAEQYWERIIW